MQEAEEEQAIDMIDEELEAPAYLDPDDQAIEVQVDDDVEPMDDDDDEEEEESPEVPDQTEMSSRQIEFHTGPIYAVGHDHNGAIITGGGDDQAAIHTSTTDDGSSSSKQLHKATDSVAAIAVCQEFLAIGSYDGRIVVISDSRLELDGPTDVEWLSFHATGTVLLAGSTDGTVWMYSVRPKAQCMQVFVGHEGAVTAGSFVLKVAVTCSADGSIRIWAPKTGMAKCVLRCGEMGLTCLAVGGGVDGKLVLAGGEDGMAYCCHIGSQKIVHRFEHTPNAVTPMAEGDEEDEEQEAPLISVEAVGFSPSSADSNNTHWCATGGVDGVLKIWDLTTGQCRHVCRVGGDDTGGITRLQWIEQHFVVTCGTTGVVRIWDARSGTHLQTLTAKGAAVMNDMSVSTTATEIEIVTGSDDGIVRVFTVPKEVLARSTLTP